MVIISQEFYYFTSGSYRHRKALKYYYGIEANGSARVLQVIKEGQMDPMSSKHAIAALPSVQVSASQYKALENKQIG